MSGRRPSMRPSSRRARREEATGRKPGGEPPRPPVEGAPPTDQINPADEASRIMPVAGGPFEQCHKRQAVATENLLVVAAQMVQGGCHRSVHHDRTVFGPRGRSPRLAPRGLRRRNETGDGALAPHFRLLLELGGSNRLSRAAGSPLAFSSVSSIPARTSGSSRVDEVERDDVAQRCMAELGSFCRLESM
jgi:hypothetical protein